jgi:hypothetical protein
LHSPARAILIIIGLVFGIACRRLRSVALFRRRLAGLLLVLYVAALHGLPALHQAFHRNDHVHELGGLRWLRPLPPHVHATGELHQPSEPTAERAWFGQRLPQLLRAAEETCAPPLHLALGPAHGSSALLAPIQQAELAEVCCVQSFRLSRETPSARDFFARPRARAPPQSV